MNASYKYLLFLFAFCILSGCYRLAEDTYHDDNPPPVVNDTTDYDRQCIYQNLWTYEQMREHYLWEEYMPDSTKLDYRNYPTTFFDKLLYKGDRFSWIERNDSYRGSSLYDRLGLETVAYLMPSGKKVYRTALVLPDSPAENAGIRRGDWFVISNANAGGMNIETGKIDGLAFLPEKKLTILASEREYTDAVSLDTIYQLQGKKIGYLVYNSFEDGMVGFTYPYRAELRDIFGDFKDQGITDLIIDLRYNPGGYVSICEMMCSLVLPDEYHGKVSGYHSFNRNQAAKRLKETGNEEDILYFPTKNLIGDNNVGLRKIYCIITRRSASASESLIHSLAPYIEVVTVGSPSVGKNVGSYQRKSNDYEWQLQPITFYYYNKDHKVVPDTGIVPDLPVDENTIGEWYDLGDTREKLLSVALEDITGATNMRSTIEYGRILLTPSKDEGLSRRRVEGLMQ